MDSRAPGLFWRILRLLLARYAGRNAEQHCCEFAQVALRCFAGLSLESVAVEEVVAGGVGLVGHHISLPDARHPEQGASLCTPHMESAPIGSTIGPAHFVHV